MSAHCKAKNRRGEPCGAWANDSGFCFYHDPARAKARAKARRAGGKARHGRRVKPPAGAEPARLAEVRDVLALVERAVNDVLALENSITRARALGYLAGAALKAFEVSELAERLAALETRLVGLEKK